MYSDLYSTDIIVIGAGLSGLTAAYVLLEKVPTLSVMVLEANDRIGGRLMSIPLTIKDEEFRTFDFGGQWISGSQTHLSKLLKEFNINMHKSNEKRGKTIGEFKKGCIHTSKADPPIFGGVLDRLTIFRFFVMMEKYSEKISFLNPLAITDWEKFDNMSMEEFITKNIRWSIPQETVRNIIRSSCGIEPAQISVLFYLAFCNGTQGISNQYMKTSGRETWIKGGAQEICHRLLNKISKENLRLSDPVIHIQRTEDYVIVETENEIYNCSCVILAIPPNEILKINFAPPLPDSKIDVLTKITSGHIIKFVITYNKAFWKEKGFSGDIINCTDDIICSCYDSTSDDKAALVGYIFPTENSGVKKDDNHQNIVLKQLARYFGDAAMQPLQYQEKSWCGQKNAGKCLMCHAGIGTMQNYHQIRRPIGRLFWAGTETATCWNGYMEGAVQAGQRAAVEVLYEMRPACLSVEDIIELMAKQKQINRYKDTIKARMMDWRYILSVSIIVMLLLRNRRIRTASKKILSLGINLVLRIVHGIQAAITKK